jgi:hypothetical protein
MKCLLLLTVKKNNPKAQHRRKIKNPRIKSRKYLCIDYVYNMSLSKFLNNRLFLISFAIGIFAVYTFCNIDKRKIVVQPTPDNIDLIQYKDESGTCFQFKQTQVNCPNEEKDIQKIPTQ